MRHLALGLIAVSMSVVSLAAQQSSAGLERAVERIERNDVNGLRRLLKEDPSLVRRTEAGVLPTWRWTLLHSATAAPASLEIVAALIDAGAEINVQDNEGNTPLHFAMKRINRDKLPLPAYDAIIRLLLERKADIHIVNRCGQTPLHTASAFRADPAAVELLIQAGSDVNLKTSPSCDAWTPLHGATARNSAGIVAVLLKHGADLTARDGKGLTALEVAERGGLADAAGVLRRSAAAAPSPVTASPSSVAGLPPAVVPPAPPPPASTGGTVQGRVLWNGQPVAGATVYVADDYQPGSRRYGLVTTDDQGRFAIVGVPEGNRYIAVFGDPRVFAGVGNTAFTMTGSQLTRDFSLCKGFEPVSPAKDEVVGLRPVLRWDPYLDALSYSAVVFSQKNNQVVFNRSNRGERVTVTSLQVDVDLPPGVYQWRVNAFTVAGQMIGCSFGPRGFTVRP
jgi:ankyrin repeat protein